jgi:hypothetical protein
MVLLISIFLLLIFSLLSAIHVFWGMGGRWGFDEALPTNEENVKVINPNFIECYLIGFGLSGFSFIVLTKAKLFPLLFPAWLIDYSLWFIAAVFIIRAIGDFQYVGFFKKIKTTKFGRMDSLYYSPLCLLVGVLTIILAFNIV